MPLESNLWQTVKRELGRFGVLERVENRLATGTPDVVFHLWRRDQYAHYAHTWCGAGWLELKSRPAWPKRPGTPLQVPGLTVAQTEFLLRWARPGCPGNGLAYLLLQVASTYILLAPGTAKALRQFGGTRPQLIKSAEVFSEGRFPTMEILQCLTPWE